MRNMDICEYKNNILPIKEEIQVKTKHDELFEILNSLKLIKYKHKSF